MPGERWFAVAVGRGKYEYTGALKWGTNVTGGQLNRQAGIPFCVQGEPQLGQPAAALADDVFNDDPPWAANRDEPEPFPPETGLVSVKSQPCRPVASRAVVLTREASAPNIGSGDGGRVERSDVVMARYTRPMPLKDTAGVRIALALKDDSSIESPFETEFQATNTREERSDPHATSTSRMAGCSLTRHAGQSTFRGVSTTA